MNETTKLQNPNSKEIPTNKLQKTGGGYGIGVWSLELLWVLVFGVWDFSPPLTSDNER